MNISFTSVASAIALTLVSFVAMSATGCSSHGAAGSTPNGATSAGGPALIPSVGQAASVIAGSGMLGAAGIAAVGGSGGTSVAGISGVSAGSSAAAAAGTGGGASPAGTSGSAKAGSGGAGGMPSAGAGAGGSGVAGGAAGGLGSAAASGAGGSGGNASMPSGAGAVGQHGALHVQGNRVVDAMGQPVQLRGMSLFWSQWSDYYSAGTVDQLADDWHATLVRAVLGVENDGGYLMNAAANEAKVVAIADHAIQRGMYVLVDWHDGHAQTHQSAAIDFFTRMAMKYGSSPGVIFEIYNEPQNVDWPTVKTYAQAVIAAIRGAGAKNLVIVGTTNWSQDVDVAAANPIAGQIDIAYTLHFYAATHKQALRDKAQKALDAGLALFVTEWGTCEATGDGTVDQAETKTWLSFLAQNHISWANWSLNNKAESCSALTPSAGTRGPWTGGSLTQSGAIVKPMIP